VRPIAVVGTAVLFAATPASILLIGNATFSEEVPVRVPSSAILLDSHGRTPGLTRPLPTPARHREQAGSGVSGHRQATRPTVDAEPTSGSSPRRRGGHEDGDDEHLRRRGSDSGSGGSAGTGADGGGTDDAGGHHRHGGGDRGASKHDGKGGGSDDGGSSGGSGSSGGHD
jgi:hypothetical protein